MQSLKTIQISNHKNYQPKPRVVSKKRQSIYLGVTIETTAKLLTNIFLSVCASSALFKLWPHYQSIQEKLQVIDSEIQSTTERLANEKDNFSRYFDPSQSKTIMQEQSNRVDPSQVPIILLEDNSIKPTSESTASP